MFEYKQVVWWLLVTTLSRHTLSAVTTKLNLAESCVGPKMHFCAISNSSSLGDNKLMVKADTKLLSLLELVLHNLRLPEVPYGLFQQAPNLYGLIMHNCGVYSLTAGDFAEAKYLNRLVLQQNRLSLLEGNTFSATVKLQELNLGSNSINTVDGKAFAGLSKLQYLDLQDNNIHTLPTGLFADLINLEHIDLSSNNIGMINSDTFATNTKLQTVLLSNNQFTTFSPNSLWHLPHLHLLDLSYTQLDELNLRSVDTLFVQDSGLKECDIDGSVVKVNAANNNLKGIRISDKLAVRELDLRGNQLEKLEICVGMLNLQRLDVSRNELTTLRSETAPMYLRLPSLTYLNLATNRLQNLTNESFLLLQKLVHLDLSFNHLMQLDYRILEPLPKLEKLHIQGNLLDTFGYEQFLRTHPLLREISVFENAWHVRYMHKMNAYFKDHNVQVRYTASNVLEEGHDCSSTPTMNPKHHHFAGISKLNSADDTEKTGVSGIHPYWTTKDILTMAILVGVVCIMLLQLYGILREEGCLPAHCCRCVERLPGTNNPQRLHEDDSEV